MASRTLAGSSRAPSPTTPPSSRTLPTVNVADNKRHGELSQSAQVQYFLACLQLLASLCIGRNKEAQQAVRQIYSASDILLFLERPPRTQPLRTASSATPPPRAPSASPCSAGLCSRSV